MSFLKNKFVWLAGVVGLVFAFPRLDFGQRKWLFTFGIVGVWVAWGMKKLSAKLAIVVSVVVAIAWAITYFLKLAENVRGVANGTKTSLDE